MDRACSRMKERSRPHGKGKNRSTENTEIGKEREFSYQEMKRSLDERHTQGSLTDTFRQSQMSFSIRRVNICEYTVKIAV